MNWTAIFHNILKSRVIVLGFWHRFFGNTIAFASASLTLFLCSFNFPCLPCTFWSFSTEFVQLLFHSGRQLLVIVAFAAWQTPSIQIFYSPLKQVFDQHSSNSIYCTKLVLPISSAIGWCIIRWSTISHWKQMAMKNLSNKVKCRLKE